MEASTVPVAGRNPVVRLFLAGRLAARPAFLRMLALSGDPGARLLGVPPERAYAEYERIRARGPLVPSRLGVLICTSYALCEEILRDPRFGVRDLDDLPAAQDPLDAVVAGPTDLSLLSLDEPDHSRLRRVAAPAFRPRVIRGRAAQVEEIAERLLADVARDGSPAPFDLVTRFALPFPVAVIDDLLGVPAEDAAHFARYGRAVATSLDGLTSVGHAAEVHDATVQLTRIFERLAAQRRASPGEDVVSRLVVAEGGGEVTAVELLALCRLLLLAGFETTVNLVGNAVHALLGRPGAWEELVADPRTAPAVVEETLRHDPPVQMTIRVAKEDVLLAGELLPAGTAVIPVLAAAGRDPLVHRDPDRFDPARFRAPPPDAAPGAGAQHPGHLAFSAGPHHCLGAPLARLEAEVALTALARHFPNLQPAGQPRRRRGTTLRGFTHLPVRGGEAPRTVNLTALELDVPARHDEPFR